MRVLIVDDEPPARRKVRRFLERDADVREIREAGSCREAVAAIRAWPPDLVYLDVQMPDADGFDVLGAVGGPRPFHVIVLTAHEEHALRAFDAEALDYLLKPVSPDRFERSLARAKAQMRARSAPDLVGARYLRRLVVLKQDRERLLPVERIEWAEAHHNYVTVHAAAETFEIRVALERLAGQLDPNQFAQINRAQLVNLDRIKELQPWFHGERRVVLTDGTALTWTRRYRAALEALSSRR